jgi:hypothetical protein
VWRRGCGGAGQAEAEAAQQAALEAQRAEEKARLEQAKAERLARTAAKREELRRKKASTCTERCPHPPSSSPNAWLSPLRKRRDAAL